MSMRSARFLLALTGAGRRAAPQTLQPRAWRTLSSAAIKPPSNPFEIDLDALKTPPSTTEKLTLDDAQRAAAAQQADAQHDIDLLHDDMANLFGEQVAEYGGDGASSSVEEAVAAFSKGIEIRDNEVVKPAALANAKSVQSEQPPVLAKKAGRAVESKETRERKAGTTKPREELKDSSAGIAVSDPSSSGEPVDVLLLQGPCSFVRGVWTGGDIKRAELQNQIEVLADGLGIGVKGRNYDSEKIILQTLLESREDQVVVLCWNISLSKSPFVVHALELIKTRVILVSPIGVEHGPLPANVVGVLSGFWNQSMSLAINAAAKLVDPDGKKKPKKLQAISKSKKAQTLAETSSVKMEKKILKCYLCGEEGHIRRHCSLLPRKKE